MNIKTISIAPFAMAGFLSILIACTTKTSDPVPQEQARTLNKALLVGKKWYNDEGNTVHDIRTGGKYGEYGTWSWKNNSDTMTIDEDGTDNIFTPIDWKFYWSAEHEMACKRGKSSSGEILYKDQPW